MGLASVKMVKRERHTKEKQRNRETRVLYKYIYTDAHTHTHTHLYLERGIHWPVVTRLESCVAIVGCTG